MRQAINNLQSTHSGFGFISGDNVFKVCDQPHPIIVQSMIRACLKSDVDTALEKLHELWDQGYSAVDIVITIFRVAKTFDECVLINSTDFAVQTQLVFARMPEYTKLEYIKVGIFLELELDADTILTFADRKSASPTCGYWRELGRLSSLQDS